MTPRRLIERRDSDQAMDAGFCRHQPERVFTAKGERYALESGFFTRLVIEQFALEAAALAPI